MHVSCMYVGTNGWSSLVFDCLVYRVIIISIGKLCNLKSLSEKNNLTRIIYLFGNYEFHFRIISKKMFFVLEPKLRTKKLSNSN